MIDFDMVVAKDRELIQKNIPLYVRPFCVAEMFSHEKGVFCAFLDPKIIEPVMAIYKRLYPSGDFAIPHALVGGVGFRDQMYLATVHVGYGFFSIDPLDLIEISKDELALLSRIEPEQVWRAKYSVADLWDFIYGVSDLSKRVEDADELWGKCRSAITGCARSLAGGHDAESSVQSACLAAELAMKGALAYLKVSESGRKKHQHDLQALAREIGRLSPAASDDLLLRACARFPSYVGTRYKADGLSRVERIELGIRAQAIAADVVRRFSSRNLAGDIASDESSMPRGEY